MQAKLTTETASRRRGGRPRAEQAGDVDRRILDAATAMFLQSGFDATSCDQVVVRAGAGKASLYARYANKEALFAAVVRDSVERTVAPSSAMALDRPLDVRLRNVGESLLIHALQPDVVALMRVVVATAHRMPDLAQLADRIGRDHAVQSVAAAIVGKASASPDEIEQALPVAAKFVDLVFLPNQMRALLGDAPDDLMKGCVRSVADAVDLLTGGGWLERWK